MTRTDEDCTYCSDSLWAAYAEPDAGWQLVLRQSCHPLPRLLKPKFSQCPLLSILSVQDQQHEYQDRPPTVPLVLIRSDLTGSVPQFVLAARSPVLPGH